MVITQDLPNRWHTAIDIQEGTEVLKVYKSIVKTLEECKSIGKTLEECKRHIQEHRRIQERCFSGGDPTEELETQKHTTCPSEEFKAQKLDNITITRIQHTAYLSTRRIQSTKPDSISIKRRTQSAEPDHIYISWIWSTNTRRHFNQNSLKHGTLQDSFHCPNMWCNLELMYVPLCDACQPNKSSNQKPADPLHPLLIPNAWRDSTAINFVGLLPED